MKNLGSLILKSILGFVGLMVVIVIVALVVGGGKSHPQTAPAVVAQINIGDEAYLKLKDISDPKQVICLGETKDAYGKVSKSLIANDYQGILENQQAFCVSNGTKIKVIDSSIGLRQVRIISGLREVDNDKVGMTGWTAMEFVSK